MDAPARADAVGRALRGAKAVVFDLDDTLINWRQAEFAAIGDLARDHFGPAGIPAPQVRSTYAEVMAFNIASFKATGRWWYIGERLGLLSERLGTQGTLLGDTLAAHFRVHVTQHLSLLPGALDALLAARRAGARTALLTNGPGHVQRPKVEQFGLAAHVDFIGITGEMGHWKPAPQAFLHVLARLGVEPGEAVMVGDSLDFDIEPARRLGMRTVWVDPAATAHPAADLVVAAPAGLVPHLG
ncbi:MAG: putative hydrolase of the superfamily [Thermoplasmata archaeon]|nr:putative hydrolase of the superfamily [Thermoplasmata archaeon]